MTKHTVAVIGGTGPQGKGLGYRFASMSSASAMVNRR